MASLTEALAQARALVATLEALEKAQDASPPPPATTPAATSPEPVHGLAWGARVSPAFRARVLTTGRDFDFDPNWLMACMAFETGRTFSPKVKNPGSSATGLIQFMEATARAYGTTTKALAQMKAEDQFDYVWLYFRDRIKERGPIRSLGDCYMAILNPAAMGKPDSHVMWPQGTRQYLANKGLDVNRDGSITKAEAASKVYAMLAEGLKPENVA